MTQYLHLTSWPSVVPAPIYRLAIVYFSLLLLSQLSYSSDVGLRVVQGPPVWSGQSLALPFLGVELGVTLAPPIWPINLSMHPYLRPLGATKPPTTPVLDPTPITLAGTSSFSIPPLVETTLSPSLCGGWVGFFSL